ncbi:MBL fold metallo-hydrolase [Iamia majanohamensis]|uniref:MBL fold metallo-hydrolase n=1 Tax=Iamia majanohamensis TaxID=467976 RepID=A0AAE9Y4F0_9ACTN|nr:MBL fold metallo-hydrolase [Iamia majanohamensis]WCO66042.1 MBL fold metallo-hydrolase [Iamia majanohamensis]
MGFAPHLPIRLDPREIAPDTFLLRSAQPALGAPLSVSLNSLVIRGEEPVVVDTSTVANRDAWLEDLTSLVDPADVRWIFISHDDEDHTGNLAQVLELCPAATVVMSWALTERSACSVAVPPERLRWVDPGGRLDVGDRTLLAIRPPVYDSPTTRALYDPTTGVLWASDTFATPMPAEPVDDVAEIPPPMWAEGFAMFHHHALAPWLSMVDHDAYAAEVRALRALDAEVVVAAHTPAITGPSVATAFDHLAALPRTVPPPHPDQAALEAALAGAP